MAQREREVIAADIKRYQDMLSKRRGKLGFQGNVRDLEYRLAELQVELEAVQVPE